MNPQISCIKDQGNRYLIYHFGIILFDFTVVCAVEVTYICGPLSASDPSRAVTVLLFPYLHSPSHIAGVKLARRAVFTPWN